MLLLQCSLADASIEITEAVVWMQRRDATVKETGDECSLPVIFASICHT